MSPFKFAQPLLSFEIQNGGKNEITVRIYQKKRHLRYNASTKWLDFSSGYSCVVLFDKWISSVCKLRTVCTARMVCSFIMTVHDGHCYLKGFAKYIKLIKPNNIDYFLHKKHTDVYLYGKSNRRYNILRRPVPQTPPLEWQWSGFFRSSILFYTMSCELWEGYDVITLFCVWHYSQILIGTALFGFFFLFISSLENYLVALR